MIVSADERRTVLNLFNVSETARQLEVGVQPLDRAEKSQNGLVIDGKYFGTGEGIEKLKSVNAQLHGRLDLEFSGLIDRFTGFAKIHDRYALGEAADCP